MSVRTFIAAVGLSLAVIAASCSDDVGTGSAESAYPVGAPLEITESSADQEPTTSQAPSSEESLPPPTPTTPDTDGVAPPLAAAGIELDLSRATDLQPGTAVSVQLTDSGPATVMAALQCVADVETFAASSGDERFTALENCDLSNYVVSTPFDNGYYIQDLRPNRFMANADGEVDCLTLEPPLMCVVAAGAIEDTTRSGISEIRFDPEPTWSRAPILRADPSEEIAHEQTLVARGENFPAGEDVLVTICALEGALGFNDCVALNGARKVRAGDDGRFEVVVDANLFAGATADCTAQLFGCRLVAIGARDAVSSALTFAPTQVPRPPHISLDDVANGDAVDIAVPRRGAQPGETFEVRQCKTVSRESPIPSQCTLVASGIVGAETISASIEITELLPPGITSFPECALQIGPDSVLDACSLVIETENAILPFIELLFDPNQVESLFGGP
jgi:hypothetical protein